MKKFLLSMAFVLLTGVAMAQTTINFTFTRDGENATVNVAGADGVTATIAATSPSPQGNATKTGVWNTGGNMGTDTYILCTSTNTSAATTPITYTLTVNGLNTSLELSSIVFTHITANAGGNYQPNSGNGKDVRHCNFALDVNGSQVSSKTDFDIWIQDAVGNTGKDVAFEGISGIKANDGTMTIKLSISKGTSNNGCFYGLKNIAITLVEAEVVEPEPEVYETEEIAIPTEDGVYRVFWKQNERGYLAYHDSYPTKGVLADVTLGSYGSSHFNSSTDPVELEWYLITSEGGNKYLFNVSNGKFLTYSNESADAAKAAYLDVARPCPITIVQNTAHTSYSIIKATVDGTECLLSSGCGTSSRTGYPVRWNSNISGDMGDGGSPLIFVKVIDFPVDEAILAQAEAAIEDYENPVEDDVTFQWTTTTPWTAATDLTSTVLNDNALDNGIKYIEGEVTVAGARTATVTFEFTGGNHKLNVRGVEVIDAEGNIVAGDYAAKSTGTGTTAVYTVKAAEAGTYKVRCYATDGNGDSFTQSNGTITVSFAKLDVMELTEAVTFTADYATLHLGYSVAVPAGVEAYVVGSTNGNWATMVEVKNVIPAATPVVLKKVGGATTYNFYYTSDEADEIETNLLEGSIADRYVADDAYVLGVVDEKVGLYTATKNQLTNTAFLNNANKAYLPKPVGAENIASYSFRFQGGATGIDEITDNRVQSTVIYDLTGRRVEDITTPGIYIVNGKKVLVR